MPLAPPNQTDDANVASPAPFSAGDVRCDDFRGDLDAIRRIGAVDKILDVACRTTGLGFAAVARVTKERWIALAVRDEIGFGLKPGGELEIATTICDEIRDSGKLVVIDDALTDPCFSKHPTPKLYGFRSYISVPIVLPDGRFFGTLCAIDPQPARVNTPQTIGMFQLFADLLAMHLSSQERMAAAQADLIGERASAQLRDQFIAVLGHDLRNPLSALQSSVHLLEMLPHDDEAGEVLAVMQRSVARMAELIENVLDFARGRLGGGIPVQRALASNLGDALEQVIAELQTASPDRRIERHIDIALSVECDTQRIGQMLSNLLGNALAHGDPRSPVVVRAACVGNPKGDGDGTRPSFELSVTNRGPTIPPQVREHLFKPFWRGSAQPGQHGLGLGLYIASQIAAAHGGVLTVASEDGQTCFTFRMPIDG